MSHLGPVVHNFFQQRAADAAARFTHSDNTGEVDRLRFKYNSAVDDIKSLQEECEKLIDDYNVLVRKYNAKDIEECNLRAVVTKQQNTINSLKNTIKTLHECSDEQVEVNFFKSMKSEIEAKRLEQETLQKLNAKDKDKVTLCEQSQKPALLIKLLSTQIKAVNSALLTQTEDVKISMKTQFKKAFIDICLNDQNLGNLTAEDALIAILQEHPSAVKNIPFVLELSQNK